jgi:hypothetical protein
MEEREMAPDKIRDDIEELAEAVTALPPTEREDALRTHPEIPADLEETPAPEELTGRAAKTEEDLKALFSNEGGDHISDGFKGGSGDEPGNDDGEG